MGSANLLVRTPQDVKKLGAILSVWAHPDDETYMCAGIMAAARQNAQHVTCITATKGEAGSQDHQKWPPSTLGEVRAKELKQALQALGVHNHAWMGYPDGGCDKVKPFDAINKILANIELFRPDTILTFGPDGTTGHNDHKTVSRWVSEALRYAQYRPTVYHAVEARESYEKYLKRAHEVFNIYFNIDEPPICDAADCEIYFELTPELMEKKKRALAAMPSQTEGMLNFFTPEELFDALKIESFVRAQ